MALGTMVWWFARRDRIATDDRIKKVEDDVSAINKNDLPELHRKINTTDKELGNFKTHVGENYVPVPMMNLHVVEPLRRIERKLDAHILKNGGTSLTDD